MHDRTGPRKLRFHAGRRSGPLVGKVQPLAGIAPVEADLAATDARSAYLAHLAEDGLAAGTPEGSGLGRAEQMAELERRPAAVKLRSLGAVASGAGDMAFTYGEARWVKGDRQRWAHYARIWQKRVEGWRLIADLWIAAPGTPPPTA